MININNYILEKLHLNKETEVLDDIDEINNKFISEIKKHILEKYSG